mmetsp:Transcript_27556/g.61223  ORF Transcript_27556/g.61223 Transcript_27556/m.61223 type:complete len:620 (+) Transcript_27556:246-2105(+)
MSSRSGRASRAAAPTSFVPDKANRGWGSSRAYAPGRRTAPVRNAHRVAKAGAGGGKKKSEAAKRIEAAGGFVRKFRRVRRAPSVPVGSLLTGDTMASAAAKFTIWKWAAEEDITDPAERRELGLDPLPLPSPLPLEEAAGQNMHGPTAKAARAAEAERLRKEEYLALVDEEDEAVFDRMCNNRENPYTLTFTLDGGPTSAKSGGDRVKPSAAALSTPASTTTAAAAAAASASYALATSASSKAAATAAETAATATASGTGRPASSHGASAGEKRKATRDPMNDPNRLATGLKRRGAIAKDRRYQGLTGETPCSASTTRGKPCLNACAPNSKFCFLHNPGERYDSDGEHATGGYGSSARRGSAAVGATAAAGGGGGSAFAPSMQSAVNRGGGKWKSDAITEKCERYSNQPGREKCAALTTRGKQCGFCSSTDKGGSIYCPVHRRNFERGKEKFERQQERARAELEAEKAAANDPAFAPSGSGQVMATSTATAAVAGGGSTGGSGAAPTSQTAHPVAIAQQQPQQQPRDAVTSQPRPQHQYHQQQMHYVASAGGAPFQMDSRHGQPNTGYMQQQQQQQQHYQQSAAAQMQHQHHYQHQYPQQHQHQQQHQQQHSQYQWPGP